MSTPTTVCFTWLVVTLGLSVSHAADPVQPFLPPGVKDRGWPFVRGPDFDAHSPEIHIADAWPQNGPPVLWTRTLGQGYSAFTAFGDRVYTQAQTLSGQYVECLDADSGETVWSYRYDWPYEAAGVYPGPRATPTIADGFVYFASPAGLIGCLATETGDLIWSRNVIDDYSGTGGIGFGYACSPLVIEGHVILPVGGKGASLVALDARTGQEVWASGDDPASYSPAFPIDHDGRKLIVGYFQNSLNLFDRLTGEQLGRLDLSAGYDEHSAWPIFHPPHLWISAPFRAGCQLLQMPDLTSSADAEDPRTFQSVWKKNRLLSNDVTSSVLVDGHLYGFDLYDAQSKVHRPSRGKFLCIDFLTGEEKWSIGSGRIKRENSDQPQSDEPEIGQSGIIVVDGKLLIFNEIGELILARPNPERYEELARTSVLGGELVWTPPVVHRGRVYLRNHTRAVCVYVGEPQLLSVTDQPVLTVADVPQDEYQDLASQLLSIEPEYAFDVPSREWLQRWYLVSMSLLVASGLVSLLIRTATPARLYQPGGRFLFRAIAFVAGAFGTTCLSLWSGQFIFTWPLCLFVCFDALGGDLKLRRGTAPPQQKRSRWGEWLRAGTFLAVCLVYFLICRRLSLVFEWAYLMGFPAAVPFSCLAARLRNRTGLLSVPTEAVLTLAGYTAFHFSVVAVLAIRFP